MPDRVKRKMTYSFNHSVNSKFPEVEKFCREFDKYRFRYGISADSLSVFLNQLTRQFLKRQSMLLLLRSDGNNNNNSSLEELQENFESVLPSIAEPLSEFKKQTGIYTLMNIDTRNHIKRVSNEIAEGIAYTEKVLNGKGFAECLNELQDDEEAKKDRLDDLEIYLLRRAGKPKDVKEWRKQRMAELEKELRKLTEEQEENEKQQQQHQQQSQKEEEPPQKNLVEK